MDFRNGRESRNVEDRRGQGGRRLGGGGKIGIRTIVLPPSAWSTGRKLGEIRERGVEVSFTAVRRNGITGRQPADSLELREGDVVVIYGTPEALEHAEAVLLAG